MARYCAIFQEFRPGRTARVPELEFDAERDEDAYRFVIDEILNRQGGGGALRALLLVQVDPSGRIPLMLWKPETGWSFADGRSAGFIDRAIRW